MTILPTDGIAVDPEVETDDDLLTELDLTPAVEACSDAEIMAALDVADHPSASVVAADAVIETEDDLLSDLDMTPAVCTENSNSDVVMVKPAEDRV